MTAIEKENKELKGVLPKNFARPELDKRRLGEVVDIFTNISMHKHGDSDAEHPLTFWAVPTNTAWVNSPSRKASWPVNFTPPPAW